ncbi:hypothetical protein H4R24_001222 [Coemansia sp. RSA 988]|nr:hypothetical protein H4R24_001222 [Coemansia sp. RSA 988]
MVARQGYAAQRRRHSVFRPPVLVEDAQSTAGSDTTLLGDAPCTSLRRRKTTPESRVKPISIPPPLLLPSTASPDAVTDFESPAYDSALPKTFSPTSPFTRNMLHERFSAELRSSVIEEKDEDDGVVIYNGLRRLSVSEAGLVKLSRPRVPKVRREPAIASLADPYPDSYPNLRYWNRDTAAVLNFRYILFSLREGKRILKRFQRGNTASPADQSKKPTKSRKKSTKRPKT